ncbi:MAG: glycosyltransferase family 2 protein [Bacteroidota bacterium]
MSDTPTLICLTPIKNEAWILDRFLQCASTWADHIVIADQQSDDSSRDIARRYEKVTLIDNPLPGYDEAGRQQLLIETARQLPATGPRILIALDADEMLSANWMTSPAWTRLLQAPPGTVLRFRWLNVGPNVESGWVDSEYKPFGFVDDGSAHTGRRIHSPRVPVPTHAVPLDAEELTVLHYQYASWERMKSKQRWYQCWERLHYPDKRPALLYRQYHHMDAAIHHAGPLEAHWLQGYEDAGIDMCTIPSQPYYHWDESIVDMLMEHGSSPFRRVDIWETDWADQAEQMGHAAAFQNPQTAFDKQVLAWLARTQPRREALDVRLVQKALGLVGW